MLPPPHTKLVFSLHFLLLVLHLVLVSAVAVTSSSSAAATMPAAAIEQQAISDVDNNGEVCYVYCTHSQYMESVDL
jgi:curli biogenesis system outer membrane secretion channel CsgG